MNQHLGTMYKITVQMWTQAFFSLKYEAKQRISAESALRHPYFMILDERVHLLPESKHTMGTL